jgi:general secretion pathway protein D
VTMINVQENRLKELGFDWLLNPVSLDSSNRTFLSGGTPGNSTGRTAADFVSPVNHTTIGGIPANSNGLVTGLLTNGNRSGSTAIDSNSIDGLINNPNRDAQSTLSVAPGILAVTGLFTNGQIQMIMRGLNQQKGVDITAQPSVTTRSGQESSIEILREILYPTAYEPGKVPTTVSLNSAVVATPTMPTDFKKRDVGVQLTVLPKVDVNKQYVDVTLSPIFSALDGFVNYGSPILIPSSSLLGVRAEQILQENKILMPIFSRQSVNTSIDVADGATVALGGLLKDEIQTVEDKTPILGDIPIVGRLFQSSSIQPISTAIIFLVHVEIIDPTGHSYQQK